MKWETNTNRVAKGYHKARCGHLFVRIREESAYQEPGHPLHQPSYYSWFVEPDDEDKSYRRAIYLGEAPTVAAAKHAADEACRAIVAAMISSLDEAD